MIKAYTIGMIEKYDAFRKAKAAAKYVNGTFGEISNGVFTAGATKFQVLMQVGKGDTLYTDFDVVANEDIRVADLSKWAGKQLQISPLHLPATFAVGNKLVSDANGKLIVSASPTTPFLLVDKVIDFDGVGALVTIMLA